MNASPTTERMASATFNWDSPQVVALVRAALDEDLGRGDLTSLALVPESASARARIVAKQELVLAGLPLAERAFRALDPALRFAAKHDDGALISSGAVIAELDGRARAILSAERTALNFLAHFSGIATLTRRFVAAIAGTRARIRDTRKTTPLLRPLEKYAVRTGGGANHRFGLFDAMLIKENHIAIAGGIRPALEQARRYAASRESESPELAFPEMTAYESFRPPRPVPVQVEVRNESELHEALDAGADSVLLDNVSPGEAARLVAMVRRERPGCLVEISGGIKLTNARAYAESGADFLSSGALTHSAPAADLSLLVLPLEKR